MQCYLGHVSRRPKINCNSRSKGPSKLVSRTRKPLSGLSPCPTRALSAWSLAEAVDDLAGQRPIGLCTGRFQRPRRDGLTGHTGLGESHGAGDDGVEHQVAEALQHPCHHLPRVDGAGVEAGDQDAADRQFRVEPIAYLVDGVGEQCQAAQQKNSHSVGITTPSAQASALTVSRPSDGWQSIST